MAIIPKYTSQFFLFIRFHKIFLFYIRIKIKIYLISYFFYFLIYLQRFIYSFVIHVEYDLARRARWVHIRRIIVQADKKQVIMKFL